MSELGFDVSGRDDFFAAARALARENRQFPRTARREIGNEAKARMKEAAAKALTIPVEGKKHTGLRKDVAKGLGIVPIDRGVRIITSMPEEDEAIIPRGLDTFFRGGWRHPVFADRAVPREEWKWVEQFGKFSWFMDSMLKAEPNLHRKLADELEDAADRIDRRS